MNNSYRPYNHHAMDSMVGGIATPTALNTSAYIPRQAVLTASFDRSSYVAERYY